MLFSSTVFLFVFLPLVLFFYYLPLRGRRNAQNVFLLIASLGFYAWGEPWFVLVMVPSSQTICSACGWRVRGNVPPRGGS